MGDVPPNPGSLGEYAGQEAPSGAYQGAGSGDLTYPPGSNPVASSNSPFSAQYQQPYGAPPNSYPGQFDMAQQQGPGRSNPYNMNAMMNSLPQGGYRPAFNHGQNPQRFSAGGPAASIGPQMSQLPQYSGQHGMNPMATQQYYLPQQVHMQQYYGAPVSPSQQHQHANLAHRHNIGFYPNQVIPNQAQQPSLPAGYYYAQGTPYPGPNATIQGQIPPNHYLQPESAPTASQTSSSTALGGSEIPDASNLSQGIVNGSTNPESRTNVVRGPPRKPRQSGHAIWIGNLPPQTDLMSLVHHVCKEAPGLESLFLISKSNCAFANFSDEQTCAAAQQKLHDSKFQSVRLVSRLRKNAVAGETGQMAPTGPSAGSPGNPPAADTQGAADEVEEADNTVTAAAKADEAKKTPTETTAAQKDKFFVLKSLTVEDLDLSVRNGVWATQSHNEESLNTAFQSADNVYLIFSANKSGEYFGYARMTSPINEDPAAAIEFAPKAQTTSDSDAPKSIPTEATDTCPRGKIIDDSARGTIFWEIERDEGDGNSGDGESDDSASARSGQESEGPSKAWGKPFTLEWLSTTRLPFYRTRGLRNPWNSNREVKIARDGTELETSVGRRLIGLFNKAQSPAPMPMAMRQGVAMVAGYPPPMRPPFPTQ